MMRRSVAVPVEAIEHLAASDPVMKDLVAQVGPIEYNVTDDLWTSVVGSILGQQLSVKAAATIRERVAKLGENGFPTPERLLAVPEDELRACGLSRAKTTYVRDAARAWIAGDIPHRELTDAPDEVVIDELVKLRGVGRWTAEMVLIFSLQRPDVLAVDDLGIRVAVQRAYGLAARPGQEEVLSIGEPWRPYRSYASLYLWRSLQATPA